jgi:hypothetical protein
MPDANSASLDSHDSRNGIYRCPGSKVCIYDGQDEQNHASGPDARLPPGGITLTQGSLSDGLLGYQIVLITLLGTAFLGGAAIGLYMIFPIGPATAMRRISGGVLLALCAPIGLGVYLLAVGGIG